MPSPADALRDHFLGWQCRIRQIAMRQDGGRPSPGHAAARADDGRPRVVAGADGADRAEGAGGEHRLLPLPGAEDRAIRATSTRRGSPSCRRTIFQQPKTFSDRLTAVLPEGSPLAATLLREGDVSCSSSTSSASSIGSPARCSRSPTAIRRARRRSGTTGSSIRRCRTMLRCSRFGRTGRTSPRRDRALKAAQGTWRTAFSADKRTLRTSDTPRSARPADGSARSGSAPAARAPACRGPAGCRAASSRAGCAPSR